MKMLKIFFAAAICISSVAAYAQKTKTESFKVSGECGTCKKKIEKAAREAGASYAAWDMHTKMLRLTYNAGTDVAAIQQRIADAGYDNVGVKSTTEAYDNLHACCKYDRTAVATTGNEKMDCCKDGKCTKEGHDGKDCCKKEGTAKMDCCKDGKCTKEGHDGKDCCKNEEDHKQ